MASFDISLSPKQLTILEWVRDGCADGIYDDYTPRIVSRALHNRGLVIVAGHGDAWGATLTEDGIYYLTNGAYPQRIVSAAAQATPPRRSSARSVKPTAVPPILPVKSRMPRPDLPKKPGVNRQYLDLLIEAGKPGIRVPFAEERSHRLRIQKLEQEGIVPEGQSVSVRRVREAGSDELWIRLGKPPTWQSKASSKPYRDKDFDSSDALLALSSSDTFSVSGAPRERALRLLTALINGAEEFGMTFSVRVGELINKRSTATMGPRRDKIVFAGEHGVVSLWFSQKTLQIPHEATERELTRARRGYLFPDFDDVPDQNLTIMLDSHSTIFWGTTWTDSAKRRLEDDLGRILEEIQFRHIGQAIAHETELRRADETARLLAETRFQWDITHALAIVKFKDKYLQNAMMVQAERWEQVSKLRRYAEAIRLWVAESSERPKAAALAWAEQIEHQSHVIDPLPALLEPAPVIPEPSHEDLRPYMGRYSLYRP